jgi:hypothetical protein
MLSLAKSSVSHSSRVAGALRAFSAMLVFPQEQSKNDATDSEGRQASEQRRGEGGGGGNVGGAGNLVERARVQNNSVLSEMNPDVPAPARNKNDYTQAM